MVLGLPPQLLNHTFAILEAALALHVPQGIPLDLFIRSLLFQDIDEDLVGRVGAYGVDDWEAEFALCQVFAETLEGCVTRCGGEVEVVVQDLEEEADCGDEGCAVAVCMLA